MSEHHATVRWALGPGEFLKGRYSREHTWTFDGGVTIPASPSPSVVPAPYSNAANVDPEEAFVASVASCHMLTYLHLARLEGITIARYEDVATGTMTKNERGVPWVSAIDLRPRVAYEGAPPSRETEERLHHAAHLECFISNSVKTEIRVTVEAG